MRSFSNSAVRTCPCHAGEIRDARFAFLDALIEAGWGSVPMYIIELELQRNNGALPVRGNFLGSSADVAASV